MRTALVTGATGYIGGVIAADLIHQGYRILCPTRGEPGRVAAKVQECMNGFGRDFSGSIEDLIFEVPWDLPILESNGLLPQVSVVFHCAVEMSFSALRLSESFDFNLRGTLGLYDLLAERALSGPRFFYISTAFTGGIGEPSYPEAIHTAPRILNPYQGSKWATEMALSHRRTIRPFLPTTVFRPTLVIGHSQTGWYGGKSYGLYSYLDSVHAGVVAGATELRFDVDPDVAHDYLFIDTMVDDLRALMANDSGDFSVVHSTGSRNSNAWRYERVGKEFGIPILFEKPATKADKIANRNQVFNEAFNKQGLTWNFETGYVASLTGKERRITHLTDENFSRLIRWYRTEKLN